MRKKIAKGAPCMLLLAACTAMFFLAAKPTPAENIDLIVMVDTSASMFPYFDDLMNYLIRDLLASRLHRGDTFHLLSFDATPEVEIALEMSSAEAADRAYGRILLLHPLGRYSDLVAALQFLFKYVKELPETNPKQIILITDGVHDPPPDSPNRLSADAVRKAVTDVAASMKKEGWKFDILKVPPEAAPGEEAQKSYLPDLAQSLGVPIVPYNKNETQAVTGMTTGFPTLIFPPALGKVGNRFVAPFRVKNWKSEPIIVQLSSVLSDGTELLDRKVAITVAPNAEAALDVPIRLPASYPQGDHTARVQLMFSDDLRISPTSGSLAFTYTGAGGLPFPRLTILYALIILVALALLYALVRLFLFLRRKMQEIPVTGFARTTATSVVARRKLRAEGRTPEEVLGAPQGQTGAERPAFGKKVSLLSTGGPAGRLTGAPPEHEEEPVAFSRKRVRPTVTSLRRSLPRPELQKNALAPLIEMRVSLQNPRIGFRNVHRIPDGGRRTIGGRFSSYLIFLVRVPSAIAEIRNKDGRYVFNPLRKDAFPGLDGPIEDCMEVEIPFVGPRGRQMSLYFREWVSPLNEINRIMRSVRYEGKRED
jgi:Mg-chelatase subunit ChlD